MGANISLSCSNKRLQLLECIMIPLTILSPLPEITSLPGSLPLPSPQFPLDSFYRSLRFQHDAVSSGKLSQTSGVQASCPVHVIVLSLRIAIGSVLIDLFYHLKTKDCVLFIIVLTTPSTCNTGQPINTCWKKQMIKYMGKQKITIFQGFFKLDPNPLLNIFYAGNLGQVFLKHVRAHRSYEKWLY